MWPSEFCVRHQHANPFLKQIFPHKSRNANVPRVLVWLYAVPCDALHVCLAVKQRNPEVNPHTHRHLLSRTKRVRETQLLHITCLRFYIHLDLHDIMDI